MDQLNYTRREPSRADLVGNWVPDAHSTQELRQRGRYKKLPYIKLQLKEDGSFVLDNMPDWWRNPRGVSGGTFDSIAGTWIVSQYSDDGFWIVNLKSPSGTRAANLVGQRPPYRIEFTIGDPDDNQSMIFVVEK